MKSKELAYKNARNANAVRWAMDYSIKAHWKIQFGKNFTIPIRDREIKFLFLYLIAKPTLLLFYSNTIMNL